jgi:hypothetical protein
MRQFSIFLTALLFMAFHIQAATSQPAAPQKLQKVTPPKINSVITKMSPGKLKVQQYVQKDINGDKVVQDNINKLMWEVKNNKNNYMDYDNPNDADNEYKWHDPNPNTNGGHQGVPANGTDTYDFIQAINAKQYAGYSDWRMPTIDELKILLIESDNFQYINTDLFPNTKFRYNTTLYHYWSSTTYNYSERPGSCAWNIVFSTGYTGGNHSKANRYNVRAVRDIP